MLMALRRAALGTGFLFFMTSFGAATVFFLRGTPRPRFQKTLLGFAAGVMTAASVWSLLIPAMEQTQAEARFPVCLPPVAGTLSGAAFLIALDALLSAWQTLPKRQRQTPDASPTLPERQRRTPDAWSTAPARQTRTPDATRRRTRLLFTAITLHNIPEGMAVGLACALSAQNGAAAGAAALALGIGIQNFPEGAAVSLPMRQECASSGRAFLWGTLSGAVEPLSGLLVVGAATLAQPLMPWLLSFAAGAMLCVVAEELMPQAQSRAGTCAYLAGFLLMMALDVSLG